MQLATCWQIIRLFETSFPKWTPWGLKLEFLNQPQDFVVTHLLGSISPYTDPRAPCLCYQMQRMWKKSAMLVCVFFTPLPCSGIPSSEVFCLQCSTLLAVSAWHVGFSAHQSSSSTLIWFHFSAPFDYPSIMATCPQAAAPEDNFQQIQLKKSRFSPAQSM